MNEIPQDIGPLAALRRVTATTEWREMPADERRRQLARYLSRYPELAREPEMAGVLPDDGYTPGLRHISEVMAEPVSERRYAGRGRR